MQKVCVLTLVLVLSLCLFMGCLGKPKTVHGRGWDSAKEGTDKNDHENWRKGPNYADQWQTVFKNDYKVSSVFLTGWNEWAAQKLQFGAGTKPLMVDNFNAEFSRDIEPMKALIY